MPISLNSVCSEDEGLDAIRLLEILDARDVRVVQRCEELRFALEPGDALFIGSELIRQNLDRDLAIELGVASAVDFAHSALADGRDDLVRAELSSRFQGYPR